MVLIMAGGPKEGQERSGLPAASGNRYTGEPPTQTMPASWSVLFRFLPEERLNVLTSPSS
ncbi:hypothetical protein B932_3421 [Gluconobacter oxydans H24]|nr:hypothetical protein B932_3421 [Gluconobacter oxydans H24]